MVVLARFPHQARAWFFQFAPTEVVSVVIPSAAVQAELLAVAIVGPDQ